jgi:proline iminopeptidase
MEGFTPVVGGRIWCRHTGATNGCPLIVVHGGPGGTHDYLEPLESLGDDRPIVLYDQLGSGRSERPSDPSLWVLDRFVRELDQLISSLELDVPVHLFGHSWGSRVAAAYALEKPAAVRSLILAGPFLSCPRWVKDELELAGELPEPMRTAVTAHELDGKPPSAEYRAAVDEHHRRNWCRLDQPHPLIAKSYAGGGREVSLTMWGEYHFVATGNLKRCDLTSRLGEIAVPALLTCGRYDEARPATTAWYASRIPDSKVMVFESSAHMPHLEEPELYLATVRKFLREVESRS